MKPENWSKFADLPTIMIREVQFMIIAVDFDGTLCEECWPEIGKPNLKLIGELIYRKGLGDKLILWTCRTDEQLKQAVLWCESFGLTFDAVNANLKDTIEKYGSDSRKITADLYIDDKSTMPWADLIGLSTTAQIVSLIENSKGIHVA